MNRVVAIVDLVVDGHKFIGAYGSERKALKAAEEFMEKPIEEDGDDHENSFGIMFVNLDEPLAHVANVEISLAPEDGEDECQSSSP